MRVHREQAEPWQAIARRLESDYPEHWGMRPPRLVVRDADLG
jgi:hypothetical protein